MESKQESKLNVKNTNFTTDKMNEFRDLYIFFLVLGRSEEEAKKKVERALDRYYLCGYRKQQFRP